MAEPETTEFTCVDCGVDVFHFGPKAANDQHVCATCAWLREIEDPADREKLKEWLEEREPNHPPKQEKPDGH